MRDEAAALKVTSLVPRWFVKEPMIDHIGKSVRDRSDVKLRTQDIHATFGELFVQRTRAFRCLPVNSLPSNLRQLENTFVGLSIVRDSSRAFLEIAFRLRLASHFKLEPFVCELERFLH